MKKLIILFIFNISLFNINSLNNDYFSYVVGGVEPDSITSASTKKVDDSDEENSAVNGDGEVLSSKDFFNKSSFFEDAVTGASEKLSDEKENIIDHGANDNKNDYSINATTDSVTTASPGDVESSDENIDKSTVLSMDTGDSVTTASPGDVESSDENIDKSTVLSMDTGDAITAASEIYSETKEDIKEEEYLDSITKGSETVAMITEKPEDIKVEIQNPNLDAQYNKLPEKIKRDILTEDYETKLVVEKKKEFPNEDPVYSMKPNVKKSFYLTDTDIDEAATPEKQIEEEIKETPTPKTEDKQILPEKIREKVAIIDRDIEIAQKEIIIPTIDDVITPDKKEKSFFIDEDTDKPIVEIVEKTEEVVVEKPEEIKSSEKDSKDTIELKIAPQEKRQARDNKSRKTNFIIFSDETSDVVPSLMYDETDPDRILLEEEKSENRTPKNLSELISANPVFKYRENKTIINGRIAISEELALEAHKNALKLFKDNR
ncbi:MAG TPA: hypothetical protein PLI57_06685, partial [Spirochaetota bacterium]|nr:hypothetical protein [Spirochaetota bacterium]